MSDPQRAMSPRQVVSDRVHSRLLMSAAYAGMFVFGIVMALLGAILPLLSERLSFSLARAGSLFVYMNSAMLGCSLIIGVVIDRFGHKKPLVTGSVLTAAALGFVINARDFSMLVPALLLLGLGGGALNAGTNTLAADLHGDERHKASALSLLGVFFGIGALFLPFVMGALLSITGLTTLMVGSAALCVAAAVYTACLRFPAAKQAHRLRIGEMPRFFRSPAVQIMCALLFFQSGVEFTVGGFVSTYLTRAQNASVTQASWVLAAYWAALLGARIALSRVLLRVSGVQLAVACAVIAAAGALGVAVAPSLPIATLTIMLTGFALAGIYPAVLALAAALFPEHSGTVFGILFTVALVGGMTLPWLAGNLAESNVRLVFYLVAGAFVVVAGLGSTLRTVGLRD